MVSTNALALRVDNPIILIIIIRPILIKIPLLCISTIISTIVYSLHNMSLCQKTKSWWLNLGISYQFHHIQWYITKNQSRDRVRWTLNGYITHSPPEYTYVPNCFRKLLCISLDVWCLHWYFLYLVRLGLQIIFILDGTYQIITFSLHRIYQCKRALVWKFTKHSHSQIGSCELVNFRTLIRPYVICFLRIRSTL